MTCEWCGATGETARCVNCGGPRTKAAPIRLNRDWLYLYTELPSFDYQQPCSGSCSCRGRPPEESRPTTIYREYGETTPVPSGYCEVTAWGAGRRCFTSTGMPDLVGESKPEQYVPPIDGHIS